MINECVDEAAVAAALAGGSGSGKAAPPLLSVLACLEGSLGAHYQEAWDACLPGTGGSCAGGGGGGGGGGGQGTAVAGKSSTALARPARHRMPSHHLVI